jgi:hypothetical protein
MRGCSILHSCDCLYLNEITAWAGALMAFISSCRNHRGISWNTDTMKSAVLVIAQRNINLPDTGSALMAQIVHAFTAAIS